MVVGFRVRVVRLRVMGSGDHVVRVDGMVRDYVSSVAVGVASVAGGRGLVAVSVPGLGDVEVPVLPGHGGAVVPRPGPGPVPCHLLLH